VNIESTAGDLTIPARIVKGDFSGWLRDAMTERGLTTRMLARRTEISHSTISRLMRSDRQPSLPTAIALVRVLGAPPLRLAYGSSADEPSKSRHFAGASSTEPDIW
jgi:transcriptional regulator with XRE-family HTH domain